VYWSGMLWLCQVGGSIDVGVAITGGYAGTVVTNDSTFIDLTTSAVRGNVRWSVDNTKQYDVSITRTTEDDDDEKILIRFTGHI